MTPLERLEAIMRAIAGNIGGEPDKWRDLVRLVREPIRSALPHFTPAVAAELEALFAQDVGEGPTDPDPGF